jgi:hypothetical protein
MLFSDRLLGPGTSRRDSGLSPSVTPQEDTPSTFLQESGQNPHQHALPAQQSTALVLFFPGLRVVADAAATGTGRNTVGQRPMQHNSTEIIEDRCADSHHRTEGVDFAGRWVPRCRAVPTNP